MSEWIELSGCNEVGHVKRCAFRRDQILAIYAEDVATRGMPFGSLLSIAYGNEVKTVMMAGEYDIVRDEIIGGKWSRAQHEQSSKPDRRWWT